MLCLSPAIKLTSRLMVSVPGYFSVGHTQLVGFWLPTQTLGLQTFKLLVFCPLRAVASFWPLVNPVAASAASLGFFIYDTFFRTDTQNFFHPVETLYQIVIITIHLSVPDRVGLGIIICLRTLPSTPLVDHTPYQWASNSGVQILLPPSPTCRSFRLCSWLPPFVVMCQLIR